MWYTRRLRSRSLDESSLASQNSCQNNFEHDETVSDVTLIQTNKSPKIFLWFSFENHRVPLLVFVGKFGIVVATTIFLVSLCLNCLFLVSPMLNQECVLDEPQIIELIENALSKYDADKTGEADFALESSG